MKPYRAIPIDGKDFVYGWYIELGNHHLIADETTDWDNAGEPGVIEIEGLIEVIPESVGQQVPIKDIDNNWMYVGDIIGLYGGEFVRQIIWNEKLCCYQAPFRDGSGLQLFTQKSLGIFKVIGNKAQHPKLLEQDNE